ncbi:hypothetical protein [Rubellicoccus peritrichatus]|uniref:Uncharacterized protein n=1 Tax=Rubellicoccus peritrichatus TaxID=3080537 RepID=A0AAQ3LAU4_9BACT|nr:hypothetical protein [Puniceicoccus sp. CR14]WOO40837.1 hypothetical protein RZN69_19610 [Puniceicoccus sp. CR14]
MRKASRFLLTTISLFLFFHSTQAQSFYDNAQESTTTGILTINEFGPYVDQLSIGWIFEFDLGWMFSYDVGNGSAWFYSQDLNSWLWTTPEFYPAFYHESSGAWWYLEKESDPRLFFNFGTQQFVDINGNPFSNHGKQDFHLQLEQYYVPADPNIEYEGPTISDNGEQLIFRGKVSGEPVIFVSQFENENWTVPEVAFSTSTEVQNHDAKIISFSQKTTSGASENFNGPMIADDVATFGAEIDTGEDGVFYAKRVDGNWQTKLILKTNDAIAGKTVSSVDAPYVSENKIFFLTTLTDSSTQSSNTIFCFDIPKEKLDVILDSDDGDVDQFWDMSVNKARFSIRAENSITNNQNIYIYEAIGQGLRSIYPDFILPTGTNSFTVGGPTYFVENDESHVANLVFFKNDDIVQTYQIYTNLLSEFVWIKTGDVVGDSNDRLGALANPTLSVEEDAAWMFFQATTLDSNQIGAYLSYIDFDNASFEKVSYAVAQPGDSFNQDSATINQVLLGPVSLRNNRIAMTIQSDSNQYALVVYQIRPR